MNIIELAEEVESLKLKIANQEYQMSICTEVLQRILSQNEIMIKKLSRINRGYGGYDFPLSNNN